MGDAAREEAALKEEARRDAEEITASEEAAAQAAAAGTGPFPDADIAQVHRSGRQHDHTDTVAYHRPQLGRRRGPRRKETAMATALAPTTGPSTVHSVDCPHKLGSLPCMNHKPHEGDGRGCVHHSTSGFQNDE